MKQVNKQISSLLAPLCLILGLLIPLAQASSADEAFSHAVWDDLLRAHVQPVREGVATEVSYAGFYKDRAGLNAYLHTLSEVNKTDFDSWPKDEQLAFLINTYNAWTVEYVLTKWPDIKSIKDLGSLFLSPWKVEFVPLFGDKVSLDEIEHGMIREDGVYDEPLIHFAVNCASVGCPALRNEAYTASKLEAQLVEQADLFLQDDTRNRVEGKTVYLSPIFKWYKEDFEQGWRGVDGIETFLLSYASALRLSEEQKALLSSGKMRIKYTKYDWRLNMP